MPQVGSWGHRELCVHGERGVRGTTNTSQLTDTTLTTSTCTSSIHYWSWNHECGVFEVIISRLRNGLLLATADATASRAVVQKIRPRQAHTLRGEAATPSFCPHIFL